MGNRGIKALRGIRYFVAASLVLALLGLGAWAAALLPPERFSNTGAVSGEADGLEPGGDRFNSYAWSMETMTNSAGDEYLYVGSNRDIIYLILSQSGLSDEAIAGITNGDIVPPDSGDFRARIFRKKTNGSGDWETVYTSEIFPVPTVTATPAIPYDVGYRGVVSYAAPGEEAPSLYFGTMGVLLTRVLRFGPDFEPGDTPQAVFQTEPGSPASLRSLAVHDDGSGKKLYVGSIVPSAPLVVSGAFGESNVSMSPAETPLPDLQIWESSNPSLEPGAWKQVAFLSDFPGARATTEAVKYGGIWDMISFNGWLYAFVGSNYSGADDDGFLVFKGKPVPEGTEGRNAGGWIWEPVVGTAAGGKYPNGLGNPSNVTASPFLFSVEGKDYVYVGTFADVISPLSIASSEGSFLPVLNSMYPCQVYRFDAEDNWEMIIGNPQDSGGVFTERLGNFGAGFFNAPEEIAGLPEVITSPRQLSMNQYAWRMDVHKGKLYVTTFDMGVFLDYAENFATTEEERLFMEALVDIYRTYNTNPSGFDLYSTEDGVTFSPVTTDGFGDKYNYGGRTAKGTDEAIFIGTANPFYGCQVWKLAEEEEPEPVVSGGGGGCSAAEFTPLAVLLGLPLLLLRRH